MTSVAWQALVKKPRSELPEPVVRLTTISVAPTVQTTIASYNLALSYPVLDSGTRHTHRVPLLSSCTFLLSSFKKLPATLCWQFTLTMRFADGSRAYA